MILSLLFVLVWVYDHQTKDYSDSITFVFTSLNMIQQFLKTKDCWSLCSFSQRILLFVMRYDRDGWIFIRLLLKNMVDHTVMKTDFIFFSNIHLVKWVTLMKMIHLLVKMSFVGSVSYRSKNPRKCVRFVCLSNLNPYTETKVSILCKILKFI